MQIGFPPDTVYMRMISHSHPGKIVWNAVVLSSMLYCLLIVTYRSVFSLPTQLPVHILITAIFSMDIALQFISKVKLGHIKLENPQEIRSFYLTHWFIVDLLAAMPFDLAFSGFSHPLLSLLPFLRLLKFLKLFRIFHELQEAVNILPSVMRLIMFGYSLVALLHIMIMGWILIGGGETYREAGDQYIRALYWVITTISTIGYGDYFPDHESNAQLLYTIVLQLFGVAMFSYVIANVSSMVTNLDVARSMHQKKVEEINAFMRSQRIPAGMQERVRDYYSYVWSQQRGIESANVLQEMPSGLTQEILLFLNKDLLSRVSLFRNADDLFLRESVRLMKPCVFLPEEYIIRQGEFADCMYFLASGSVRIEVSGTVVARLEGGSPFGETALVENQFRNADVVSETYGTGYRLEKEDFNVLRSKYPEFNRQVESIIEQRKTAGNA